MAKVIEYCEKHVGSPEGGDDEEELKKWDAEFLNKVNNQATLLFNITSAAYYLDIENLLDSTLKKAADTAKEDAMKEIRKTFLPNFLNLAFQTLVDMIKGRQGRIFARRSIIQKRSLIWPFYGRRGLGFYAMSSWGYCYLLFNTAVCGFIIYPLIFYFLVYACFRINNLWLFIYFLFIFYVENIT